MLSTRFATFPWARYSSNCYEELRSGWGCNNIATRRASDLKVATSPGYSARDEQENIVGFGAETVTEAGVAESTVENKADFSFYIDSGAIHHLCNLKDIFVDMRADSRVIRFGDMGNLFAAGIGTIRITVMNGDSDQNVAIEDVLFVPGV